MPIRVTIWNENVHEKNDPNVIKIYPNGIHNAIADIFRNESDIIVRTATLDQPECGLTEDVLKETDVLFWWGHEAHDRVPDEIAQRVVREVQRGMGFIPLHSAHFSKPFKMLMGTTGSLKWAGNVKERVWTVSPSHPIAKDLPDYFEFEGEEMYGESFDIPNPDCVVFISWFKNGYVFRSGVTFTKGRGKVFYFQPGHETNPIYYNENVKKVLKNAVHWAVPVNRVDNVECPNVPDLD